MDHAADSDRHKYFEGLAVSHVLGGLSDVDGRIFRSHLLECSHCRARVGELRAIAHDLADVERDERRARAAKAIDTKRRESDGDDGDVDDGDSRARPSRLALIAGLAVAVVMVGWLVFERTANQQLRAYADFLETTTDLLVNGTPTQPIEWMGGPGDPPTVRYDNQHILVVLDGVNANEPYVIYQLNAEGRVVNAGPARGSRGTTTLPLLVDRHPDARQIRVTRPNQTPVAQDVPTGDYLFRATLGGG